MFGTAAGIWTNNVPDGSVSVRARSFDYSRVSLTIGGQPARVLYAGTAPFQVWGEFQVNAIVPTGLPSGPQPGGTTQQRPGVGDFVCQAVLFWAARPGEPFAVTRYRKDYRLRYQHLPLISHPPSPIPHHRQARADRTANRNGRLRGVSPRGSQWHPMRSRTAMTLSWLPGTRALTVRASANLATPLVSERCGLRYGYS